MELQDKYGCANCCGEGLRSGRNAIIDSIDWSTGKLKAKKKPDTKARDLFEFHCKSFKLVQWIEEYRFAVQFGRQWRFDFAWPALKIAVEIDGGIWTRGAHGNPADIERNMTKGNDAVLLGWRVLHFTPEEVQSAHAIQFTRRLVPSVLPAESKC